MENLGNVITSEQDFHVSCYRYTELEELFLTLIELSNTLISSSLSKEEVEEGILNSFLKEPGQIQEYIKYLMGNELIDIEGLTEGNNNLVHIYATDKNIYAKDRNVMTSISYDISIGDKYQDIEKNICITAYSKVFITEGNMNIPLIDGRIDFHIKNDSINVEYDIRHSHLSELCSIFSHIITTSEFSLFSHIKEVISTIEMNNISVLKNTLMSKAFLLNIYNVIMVDVEECYDHIRKLFSRRILDDYFPGSISLFVTDCNSIIDKDRFIKMVSTKKYSLCSYIMPYINECIIKEIINGIQIKGRFNIDINLSNELYKIHYRTQKVLGFNNISKDSVFENMMNSSLFNNKDIPTA